MYNEMDGLRLYVWGGTKWSPDYGADTLVVLASSVEEARNLAHNAIDFGFGFEGAHRERRNIDVDKVEPTLVIEKPGALYCWWSE